MIFLGTENFFTKGIFHIVEILDRVISPFKVDKKEINNLIEDIDLEDQEEEAEKEDEAMKSAKFKERMNEVEHIFSSCELPAD